jgi:hypothetical protein
MRMVRSVRAGIARYLRHGVTRTMVYVWPRESADGPERESAYSTEIVSKRMIGPNHALPRWQKAKRLGK